MRMGSETSAHSRISTCSPASVLSTIMAEGSNHSVHSHSPALSNRSAHSRLSAERRSLSLHFSGTLIFPGSSGLVHSCCSVCSHWMALSRESARMLWHTRTPRLEEDGTLSLRGSTSTAHSRPLARLLWYTIACRLDQFARYTPQFRLVSAVAQDHRNTPLPGLDDTLRLMEHGTLEVNGSLTIVGTLTSPGSTNTVHSHVLARSTLLVRSRLRAPRNRYTHVCRLSKYGTLSGVGSINKFGTLKILVSWLYSTGTLALPGSLRRVGTLPTFGSSRMARSRLRALQARYTPMFRLDHQERYAQVQRLLARAGRYTLTTRLSHYSVHYTASAAPQVRHTRMTWLALFARHTPDSWFAQGGRNTQGD